MHADIAGGQQNDVRGLQARTCTQLGGTLENRDSQLDERKALALGENALATKRHPSPERHDQGYHRLGIPLATFGVDVGHRVDIPPEFLAESA
jgi:hypothetical protein